jgi:two-component system, chemotaxis family, chemotaxis protein CheY
VKILVVDDEFVALNKMVSMLSRYGECEAATHGEQALQMFGNAFAQGNPYRLITLDIQMPGMSGLELLEAICEREHIKQIPPSKKIVVTAASSRSNVAQALRNHCQAFLVKPLTSEALDAALGKLGFVPSEPAASPPVG